VVKLAFMSTTAPEWTFEQLIDGAAKYGYDGIDIRTEWGHGHDLELTTGQDTRQRARQYATAQNIAIACIAISTRFARATKAERDDAVEQVKRNAELAFDLGCGLLRVFGGNIPEGHTMEDLRPHTAEALGRAAEAAAQWGVTPCLEVHDQHNNPDDVVWILEHTGHGNAGAVWHPAHHIRLGISVDEAYPKLRPWVRHLHLQDLPADYQPGQRAPFVPIGEGNGHLARAFELLAKDNFQGFAACEYAATGAWRNADASQPEHYAARHPDEALPKAAVHLESWRDAALQAAGRR
jgi:sugar phosphate isomerase/epimerase